MIEWRVIVIWVVIWISKRGDYTVRNKEYSQHTLDLVRCDRMKNSNRVSCSSLISSKCDLINFVRFSTVASESSADRSCSAKNVEWDVIVFEGAIAAASRFRLPPLLLLLKAIFSTKYELMLAKMVRSSTKLGKLAYREMCSLFILLYEAFARSLGSGFPEKVFFFITRARFHSHTC